LNDTAFDKYEQYGAYHWIECDRRWTNWKRYNPALEARYDITCDAVRKLDAHYLLDIGTGDGCLLARLSKVSAHAIGIDTEPRGVDIANKMLAGYRNVEVRLAISTALQFANGTFDVITSADVIEHLTNPEVHLREICRVMRQGGTLVMTTPIRQLGRVWDTRHVHEYDPSELRTLLERFFRSVEIRYFWPTRAIQIYETRVGWRLLKLFALVFWNPFRGLSTSDIAGTQMIAICSMPRAQHSGASNL